MTCDAKVRPLPDATELTCENAPHGPETNHRGVLRNYAYHGSRTEITWLESDRRNFRGDWLECPERGCVLPAGHHGNHAQ